MGWLDITLSGNDKAYLGAALGVAAGVGLAAFTGGASLALAGAAGGSLGASLGGMEAQKDNTIIAENMAQKDAEKARVASVTAQQGAKQQAESIALAGLTRTSKTGTSQQAPGFIGQNLPTSAGTF